MMPILVKSDDVRRGRKAKVRHRRLRAATGVNGLLSAYDPKNKSLQKYPHLKGFSK